ncbi:bile acid:sodium symporter, partial [bacterium]|nr:bile acid:sodium symporter [bacterium]
IYLVVGISALWKSPIENQLASAISLGNMNNVLVLVFASEFFTPLEPTVAAMYMIPFFGLILPLRVYQRLRKDYSPR